MDRKNHKGSLTVYFCMMVLPTLALVLLFLGLTRYWIERNDALRITQIAGNGALSCYYAELTDRYGLFGTDGTLLESRIKTFIEQNQGLPLERIHQMPSYWLAPRRIWKGLFSYSLREMDIVSIRKLNQAEVLQDQIQNFMRYRWIQEGMQLLLEYLGILEDAAKESGIQSLYAGIQREVLDYNNIYAELIRCLYGEGGQTVYVTMTHKEEYRPGDPFEIVQRQKSGKALSDEERRTLVFWQEYSKGLAQQNQRAAHSLEKLEASIASLKGRLQDWKNAVNQYKENHTMLDVVEGMITEVEELENTLWGLHGETEELRDILQKNQKAVEPMEDAAHKILAADGIGEELSEEELREIERAAKGLRQYDGNIALKYERAEQEKALDIGGIWEWICQWKIDLEKYGKDEDLLEGEASSAYEEEKALNDALEALEKESENGAQRAADKIALTEYILGMFQNMGDQVKRENGEIPRNLRGEPFEDTFFKNEAEFILQGSYNEYRNLKGVEYKIIGLRVIMNTLFLASDGEKQRVIQAAAQSTGGIIAPGVGNAIAYGAILFLWSTAESYVDYSILLQGGSVPMLKNKKSWNTDLKAILEKSKDCVREQEKEEEGFDYEMYLRILLLLADSDTCLERVYTLIQLNLPDIALAEAIVGFDMITTIQGNSGIYLSKAGFQYE